MARHASIKQTHIAAYSKRDHVKNNKTCKLQTKHAIKYVSIG